MEALYDGILLTTTIELLDLSYCSLGAEEIKVVELALARNETILVTF